MVYCNFWQKTYICGGLTILRSWLFSGYADGGIYAKLAKTSTFLIKFIPNPFFTD